MRSQESFFLNRKLHDMVDKCVAAGCSNVSSGQKVYSNFLETLSTLRKEWIRQVQRTRAD